MSGHSGHNWTVQDMLLIMWAGKFYTLVLQRSAGIRTKDGKTAGPGSKSRTSLATFKFGDATKQNFIFY